MARPLRQPVVHIENPGRVEYVTCRLERLRHFGRCPKVEERRKRKPHNPSFISDGCAATTTADFAGQISLSLVQLAIEESQLIEPCGKSDVVLMEYGSPLHRRTVELLAHDAVADFCIYRIGADLISNSPAVAARFVLGLEVSIVGACVEFCEFIHESVSAVGRGAFNMELWTDDCPIRRQALGLCAPP